MLIPVSVSFHQPQPQRDDLCQAFDMEIGEMPEMTTGPLDSLDKINIQIV